MGLLSKIMRPSIRISFALLITFLFLNAEAQALGPGVPYGGGRQGIQGSYTGILLPGTNSKDFDPTEPIDPDLIIGSNSLGLFAISSQATGIITGSAIFFLNGTTYNAQIAGISDSQKGQIFSVLSLQSVFQYSVTIGTTTRTFFLAGSGRLVAGTQRGTRGAQNLIGTATAVENGSALIGVPMATYNFIVNGVQQSTTGAAADLTFTANSGT